MDQTGSKTEINNSVHRLYSFEEKLSTTVTRNATRSVTRHIHFFRFSAGHSGKNLKYIYIILQLKSAVAKQLTFTDCTVQRSSTVALGKSKTVVSFNLSGSKAEVNTNNTQHF